MLTADQLIEQATEVIDLHLPEHVLGSSNLPSTMIRIKPLTLGTFQLITKASKENLELMPLLIIKESIVSPALDIQQVKNLNLGLVTFLIENIKKISGLPTS